MARNYTTIACIIIKILNGHYHQSKRDNINKNAFDSIPIVRLFYAFQNSAKSIGTSNIACPANFLVFYKLANLILSLPPQEELLPIFCQKFFHLYLTRIRFTADEERFTDTYGVADKLYDTNITLMKKLKKFFIDCAKFEKERSTKVEDQNISDFYMARSR